MRRPFKADAPVKEGPRSNREIRVPRVQLIDEEGQNLGSMPTDQALKLAEEAGLDLVEISPNAEPPVCKILDLGKLKYATQKKAAEARKKHFEDGDKVKVTLKFRGREMAHQELGMKLLLQVKEDTQAIAKVEAEPKLEGRQMMMVPDCGYKRASERSGRACRGRS
ncbi:MAG: translation initiation factor IF-3 [Agrobacterium fabrum]|uniref:Translation initiation factor IF-3 n=1 Tax=Agrobacterium fabrum TaxID=1176649 RepID=A0A2W5EIR5_9HYPH|nr:MAG: translation initiation factor IF-3 [Agrobacterium fabrum]